MPVQNKESNMSNFFRINYMLWTIVTVAWVFCISGCESSRISHIPSSGLRYHKGTFAKVDQCIAELNVRQKIDYSIGSTTVWKNTFCDYNNKKYNAVVTLYIKEYRNGWAVSACPVYKLTVNGKSVIKDAQGYGHMRWSGSLVVNGIKLDVTGYEYGTHEAKVYIEDASLW